MTKIVYNACYGGFSLSDEGFERYLDIKGIRYFKSAGRFCGFHQYYRVPEEEFEQMHAVEQAKPISPTRFDKTNALYLSSYDIERADPALVQVVEELGDAASGRAAKLRIADLEPGTLYRIDEYDGYESIMTQDDYDWSIA